MRKPRAGTPAIILATLTSALGYISAVSVVVPAAFGLIALRRISGYSRRLDPALRICSAAIPLLFGIRVRTRGSHNLPCPAGGPFVIISNHINLFDGFVLRGYLPCTLPLRALELASHFSWPLYGLAMRLYGNIPVPHNTPRDALRSLETARNALRDGESIVAFPEGHRTRTGTLQRFMRGPFQLARAASAPILPVIISGAFERQRTGSFRVFPGMVELHVCPPIPATDVGDAAERELRDHTREIIGAVLERRTDV